MKNNVSKSLSQRRKSQKGFTLLEYCAGAAVLAAVIFGALNTMGGQIGDLMTSIGDWSFQRAEDIRQNNPQ